MKKVYEVMKIYMRVKNYYVLKLVVEVGYKSRPSQKHLIHISNEASWATNHETAFLFEIGWKTGQCRPKNDILKISKNSKIEKI